MEHAVCWQNSRVAMFTLHVDAYQRGGFVAEDPQLTVV
jgi:hypothetical protein